MEDRELLELAAKAAGMHKLTEWSDGIWDHDSPHYGYPALHEAGPGGACGSWNPLTDDGDALRLVVKLGLQVKVWLDDKETGCGKTDAPGEWGFIYDHKHDAYAKTRRAIVRAAAEIGRTK
ncbi:hypothetical protein [Pseudomonas phage PS-1]|uniref:hypothetical protein n=1 Tax=Pseudomonas phage PS-1 TaxID=1573458 RepID=UPI00065C25F0|nr:hypothetical protein AXI79_gp20 [Pseudomonas phage PS-1]BAR92358.1 hypothetical protein [Pseudomonas phage PS-1]